jgi:ABC-type multidrug transport system ATPase subunit
LWAPKINKKARLLRFLFKGTRDLPLLFFTVILEGVSGSFLPGTLTAVMGPSGAGKTSLISVLSGQATKTSGDIFVNGKPQQDLGKFNSVMGFVPQEVRLISPTSLKLSHVPQILGHHAQNVDSEGDFEFQRRN